MLNPRSFIPTGSKDPSTGTLVIQKDYLTLPGKSECGIPGIFQIPVDEKDLCSPSYDLVTKGVSFAGHDIVRCVVTPASDITVIPCDLTAFITEESEFKIEKTNFFLQSSKDNKFIGMTGESTRVNLGLVLRSARDLTQKFQIDGAVLLNLGLSIQLPPDGIPVCQLGMDFITKYPYLFYVPRSGPSGTIDFMIARDPFASRPYSVEEQFYKTVIVHVDGYYDKNTGKIGYGIFFKSGSVLNMLSGVSMYDKAGNKHKLKLRERGILMAIIKTLHAVSAFPIGRDFRGVVIKSTDPSIARLMAVTQVTMRNIFTNSKRINEDDFDPMEGGYYYPNSNRDLMLYFCRTFLRKELGFKIVFEDSKLCGQAQAANMLAITASQMEEFPATKELDNRIKNSVCSSTQTRSREMDKASRSGIASLLNNVILGEDPPYISLGLDGYFSIERSKVHAIMKAADLVGMDPQKKVEKSTNLALNKNRISGSKPTADTKTKLEEKIEIVTNAKPVIGGSIDEGYHRYGKGKMNEGSTFAKSKLEYNHEIQTDDPVLKKMEMRIRDEADARILEAKNEGKNKYLSAEKQMVIQMQHIAEEGLVKQQLVNKQINDDLTGTKENFNKKREFIVNETKAKIDMINAEVARCLELVGLKALEDAGKNRSIPKGKMKEGTEWSRNNASKRFRPLRVNYNTESE
ncbi:hypothetical protein DFP73DRAFT_594326 [Morchella snyderi]|nr:hypothetical protein DFP73DRAFT_594326 [Morchella snyderi]